MKNLLSISLAALALLGCASSTTKSEGPGPSSLATGLVAAPARVTDERILGDRQTIEALQQRVRKLNESGIPQNNYPLAKAQCWLDTARSQYHENDRTGYVEESLTESSRIIKSLEADKNAKAGFDTPLVARSTRLRDDLWAQLGSFKSQDATLACNARTVACAEVRLVRAGHAEEQTGWRAATSHIQMAEEAVRKAGIEAANVAGVIIETYQGGSASFAPPAYMQQLRKWCDAHKILLVCDEVQAGFGRTGTMWGFEHYGIVPDLTTWGKGISSSLPLAAVIGRPDVMDLHPAGSMTSTHTGNPVCCAAALASIDLVVKEDLAGNSRRMGDVMHARLHALKRKYPRIGCVDGKGLVAGVAIVKPGTKDPDAVLAFDIVRRTIEKGVLMFSPVGLGGGTVKICPPLVINEEAMNESLDAFEEAVAEAFAG